MNCPLCFSPDIELINVGYAFVKHLDFTNIRQKGVIGRCGNCHILYNLIDEKSSPEIDDMFKSVIYSQSKQTHQTVAVDKYEGSVTRSFLQAKIIKEIIKGDRFSILDVGCFDGALLKELDSLFPSSSFYGYDINEHVCSIFPKKDNFSFLSGDIENVQGEFDLICMSHSIIYMRDLSRFMKKIKQLLKSQGLIFVQVSDLSRNPYSLLLGDQYYYFTKNIIDNFFSYFGFRSSLVNNSWFPREIAVTAKQVCDVSAKNYLKDTTLCSCLEYLKDTAERLGRVSKDSRLAVLGTTVNAAFVDNIIGDKIDFFVDENQSKVGAKFRNKDVLCPESLCAADSVIIPYWQSSEGIKEKFRNKYKGRFICC